MPTTEFIRSAHRSEDFVRDGRPEIAFVGRSNVGKSSLLNALAGSRKLARTGSTPGRTRSVNYFLVDGKYYLVDLPGYGYARVGRDERQRLGRVAERYLEGGSGRRVVLLVDAKVGATALDVAAFTFLSEVGAAVVVAATKADRVKRGERERQRRSIRESLELPEGTPLIFVSARTGEGLNALWREIWPTSG
ncbi:MAG TPA: ribosome biogenesis GTP-binding protein YihA/YsxC [Thermoanaerobaculia bacterium]|nr:ribosome biogenesis GTP-binding protein YihA/YsxC [Thermoanaerobaculia bacterium]